MLKYSLVIDHGMLKSLPQYFFYSFTHCPQISDFGFAKCSAYYVLFLVWTEKLMFNSKVGEVKL